MLILLLNYCQCLIRIIGYYSVDAGANGQLHVLLLINGPDVDRKTLALALLYEAGKLNVVE